MGLAPWHEPTSLLTVRLTMSPPQKPSLEHSGNPVPKSTRTATRSTGSPALWVPAYPPLPWGRCPSQQCSWYLPTLTPASREVRTRSPCLSRNCLPPTSSFVHKYLTSLHRQSALPVCLFSTEQPNQPQLEIRKPCLYCAHAEFSCCYSLYNVA